MPNPIDVYVGRQLRYKREKNGLTQDNVTKYLGITFQQVQKYQKSQNRISASTLSLLSEYLDCTPNCFFKGFEKYAEGK